MFKTAVIKPAPPALAKSLQAIADQTKPYTIVVRVKEGATDAETTSALIGTTTAEGKYTGIRKRARCEGSRRHGAAHSGCTGPRQPASSHRLGHHRSAVARFRLRFAPGAAKPRKRGVATGTTSVPAKPWSSGPNSRIEHCTNATASPPSAVRVPGFAPRSIRRWAGTRRSPTSLSTV